MDELLTVREVAERLKLTEKSVRRYISEGKLPAVKLGRVLRVREADLETFVEERQVRPGGGAGGAA